MIKTDATTAVKPVVPTLYEIDDDMAALAALLDEIEGDLTDPATAAAVDQWWAENEQNVIAKLEGYCRLTKNWGAQAESQRKAARELGAKAKANENRVESLRERLLWFFTKNGLTRMAAGIFNVTVKDSPWSMRLLVDPVDVPRRFLKDPEVDKTKLREALDAGDPVAITLAVLERGKHIEIR